MSASSASPTDAELVEQARHGDRPAFDELLRRHDATMRSLAFRLLADRQGMDDVLQDAYVKAYRGLPGFAPTGDFGRWLYRVTYNCCIDEIRHRKSDHRSAVDDDEAAAAGSTSEAVRQALADLSPGQRVTLVLVDGEGFDHHTAAEILGVAPGTVASRLYRARTKLRRSLWELAR
jgi:RNA polymerase sigma-70 factor (ECF subfamily)